MNFEMLILFGSKNTRYSPLVTYPFNGYLININDESDG